MFVYTKFHNPISQLYQTAIEGMFRPSIEKLIVQRVSYAAMYYIPCNINVNVATAHTNELPLARYTDNVCTEIARFPRTSVNDFVTLYEGNLIR